MKPLDLPAPRIGLVVLTLLASTNALLAAPDEAKTTTNASAAQTQATRKSTKKIGAHKTKVPIGAEAKFGSKRIKKYKLVDGKMVEIPESSGSTSTPTPAPAPTPRVATGRRVRIAARFIVTNADDGFHPGFPPPSDKRVELNGIITMGGQNAFYWDQKPNGRAGLVTGNEVKSSSMIPTVLRYDDPNHRFFEVKGTIVDVDKASGNDEMWVVNQRIDLLQIMNSNAELLIKGDRKSESGDLYIRVTDAGEIFN